MSIAFLRELAFGSELSAFFTEDPLQLIERGANGMHLRFDDRLMLIIGSRARGYDEPPENAYQNWYKDINFSSEVIKSIERIWRYGDLQELEVGTYHRVYQNWVRSLEKERKKIVNILVDIPLNLIGEFDGPREFNGYPIVYRAADPIHAQFAAGDSIETKQKVRGTLCGFLKDSNSDAMFALTCGHIGREVGFDVTEGGNNQRRLGKVAKVITPAGTGKCNRYAQPAANGLDAALIAVDPHAVVRVGRERIVKPIESITQGDLVTFHGQGGRRTRVARVAAATIWKEIDVFNDGRLFCCGDILEIGHRGTLYINSPLSKHGDSGAAVVRSGEPLEEWLGMLIGGSGSASFVCYSEHIMDWAASISPNVALLP